MIFLFTTVALHVIRYATHLNSVPLKNLGQVTDIHLPKSAGYSQEIRVFALLLITSIQLPTVHIVPPFP